MLIYSVDLVFVAQGSSLRSRVECGPFVGLLTMEWLSDLLNIQDLTRWRGQDFKVRRCIRNVSCVSIMQ